MLALLFMNRMSILKRKRDAVNKEPVRKKQLAVPDLLCCRTCLGTADLEPLFYKDNEIQRSEDLRVVTGLEINVNDGLSQMICSKCLKSLEAALKFRRKSRKAQKALMAVVNSKPTKQKTRKLPKKVLKVPKPDPGLDYNDHDYGYNPGDDYQNDHDYVEDNVDVKPIISDTFPNGNNKEKSSEFQTEKKPKVRRKQWHLPNAASYKCGTCNKEFRMKTSFQAHMRFHTNYCVCESCGKRCRNNNQLQEHKRARHGLVCIHKCTFCEYSSATKEALVIHERRHTGERPYICDHCGASFHRRSNLVQHIAIHLPEKNFQCSKCPVREKSHRRLQIHEYKAHRRKRYRYICPACNETFARPGNVRRHLLRRHGIKQQQQQQAIQRVPIPTGIESMSADVATKK